MSPVSTWTQVVDVHLDRLSDLSLTLQGHHVALAGLLQKQTETKLEAWFNSQGDTLGAREKEADYSALPFSKEIIRIKGEIASLLAERDELRLLVSTYNLRGT